MFFVQAFDKFFQNGEMVQGHISIYDRDNKYLGEMFIEWDSREGSYRLGFGDKTKLGHAVTREAAMKAIGLFLELISYV